jgi:hypothetical protein
MVVAGFLSIRLDGLGSVKNMSYGSRFEVFAAVKIQVVFWIVTPYCGRTMTLLRSTLKREAARSSETLVSYHNTTRHRDPEDPDFSLYLSENLLSHISAHLDFL